MTARVVAAALIAAVIVGGWLAGQALEALLAGMPR